MEEGIKKPGGVNKALKIAGIVAGIFILLIFILFVINFSQGLLGGSEKSSTLSVSQPAGLSGRSSGMNFNNPIGSAMPSPKSADSVQEEMSATDASGGSVSAVDKKIIKNGNLSLRVDSVDKAAEKITEIAKSNGGDVFSSNFNQYKTSSKSGNITLKVPFKNFEKAFGEVKKVAIVVVTESTTGQDVTEQYTDLQAQLKNKQAEEQSYVKLLGQAQKMDDVIAVTRQLSITRGEIERLQGRIRLMDAQTDMATISVSLSEDVSVTIVDSWRPWQVVKESTRELVKSVQDWIDFIIRLIIKVIPVLLLYGLIIYIFYRIGKTLYRKFWKKETPVQ